MIDPTLTAAQVDRLRAVAAVLLPGDEHSPAASDLADFDELLNRAVLALGPELESLRKATDSLPETVDLGTLAEFEARSAGEFEVISAVVAGAYFMSPVALESIGYATGPRVAAPFDLAADELESGILEPVVSRGSHLRMPSGGDS